MFDLFNEIAQTLSRNKLRTALTGFAVAWGIFMLIVLLSIANGVISAARSNIGSSERNTISIWPGTTAMPFRGYKDGRTIEIQEKDMAQIKKDNSEYVTDMVAMKDLNQAIISTDKGTVSGLSGTTPDQVNLGYEMLYGRFINQEDLKQKRKVLVLPLSNVQRLYDDPEKVVGTYVNAMGLSWLIVGVYDHRFENYNFIPLSTAMYMGGYDGKLDNITVYLPSGINELQIDEVDKGVRQTMAQIHEFNPEDRSALWIWNRAKGAQQMNNVLIVLNIAFWVIGLLTLISGIVGVSNIMFVSVRERTHEIGIRRALGAKPRHILTQVVAESVSITTIFGYVGLLLGMILMGIINHILSHQNLDFIHNAQIDISIAIEVTIVLIICGAFAGLFPAIKATKVKPIEALREE